VGRSNLLDRVVGWVLDPDGDLYGDERERLRWYEGMATAANLQWIAVPWAAAVLIWVLGRPAALPLSVIMAAMYLPMLVLLAYMHRRRVDTAVRRWTPKTVILSTLGGLPYVLFVLGCVVAFADVNPSLTRGMGVGAVVGSVLGVAALIVGSRRRQRRETAIVEDVD
jgi:hypothetical protein